jgi:hypothetical protein
MKFLQLSAMAALIYAGAAHAEDFCTDHGYCTEYNNINGTLYNIIPLDEYLEANPKIAEIVDFESFTGERILGYAESQERTGWLTSKIAFICWKEKCNPVGGEVITVNEKKFKYVIDAATMDDWEYIIHLLKGDSRVKKVTPVILDEEIKE